MDYYLVTFLPLEDVCVSVDTGYIAPPSNSHLYRFIVPSTPDMDRLERELRPWFLALGLKRDELFFSGALNLGSRGVKTPLQAEIYLKYLSVV